MSTSFHTNTKSTRYKTVILIIGVIVALMIGFGVSANPVEDSQSITESLNTTHFGWILGKCERAAFVLIKATTI